MQTETQQTPRKGKLAENYGDLFCLLFFKACLKNVT